MRFPVTFVTLLVVPGFSLALTSRSPSSRPMFLLSRRTALASPLVLAVPSTVAAAASPDLKFSRAPSGLEWADAKTGSGPILERGSPVTIDYVMSTSGARYGSKIYSSQDSSAPYRWVLGEGSTIAGLEQAIMGGDGIPPMQPGGIRRVIIPPELAYASLAKPIKGLQKEDCLEGKGPGPIPPLGEGTAGEYYQRFKNIYCNANRPYQPDLVMDIKLYGKRAP